MKLEHYEIIFNNSHSGMFVSDLSGQLINCNSAFLNVFGYNSIEEMSANGTWSCFPNKNERINYLDLLARRGTLKDYKIISAKKDKSKLIYKLNSTLVIDDGVPHIIGSVLDITETESIESELFNFQEYYKDLVGNTTEIIQSVNSRGELIFCNNAWFKKFEYTFDEVKKLNLFDLIHDSDKLHCQTIFAEIMTGKSFENVNVRFVSKSGKTMHFVGNIVPIKRNDVLIATHAFFDDVTQTIEDQSKIKEQDILLETVFESLPLCIYVKDEKGNYLHANSQMKKLLGCDVVNTSDNKLFDSETSLYLNQKDKLAAKKETIIQFPLEIKLGESVKHFLCGKRALKDTVTQKSKIFGYTLDITDQYLSYKQFTDELKKSKEELQKLALIATHMPDNVVITDDFGKITWVNNSFTETTGYTLGEVLGKKPRDFLQTPMTEQTELNRLSKGLSEKKFVEATLTNIDKLGNLYYNNIKIIPVFNSENKHTNFISVQKNITEEIRQKTIIQNLNKFYKNTLRLSHSEISVLNADLVVEFYNREAINTSTVLDFIENMTLHEIIETNPDKNNWINDLIVKLNNLNEINKEYTYEISEDKENGDSSHYLISICLFENENEKPSYIVSGLDITKIKKYQSELINKNNELQKINSELDNFVYSVSHDLRSPLLAINGLIKLVMSSKRIDAENANYINLILKSVVKLDGTIHDILDYSRNIRSNLKYEIIDVEKIVSEQFNDLKFSSDKRIELNFLSKINTHVISDRVRFTSIIKNLLSNSIKYCKKNEVGIVKFEISENDNYHIFELTDNGIGIAEEHIKNVFEMFYRATEFSVGTGLGLYIVKESLNKLNGKISISSKLNIGTKIVFEIPKINKH